MRWRMGRAFGGERRRDNRTWSSDGRVSWKRIGRGGTDCETDSHRAGGRAARILALGDAGSSGILVGVLRLWVGA